MLLGKVGTGMHVSTAAQIAKSVATEHSDVKPELARLGSFAASNSRLKNAERDMRRWVKCLFGASIEFYDVVIRVPNVSGTLDE
eukprot:10351174-Alexandrium_andersonii.AAC.1